MHSWRYILNKVMINIVTIDPSLLSTGIVINGQPISIASEKIALTKKLKYTKWFELVSPECDIVTINTEYNNDKKYSTLETSKLETFQSTAKLIRDTVDKHCSPAYTICLIEGYSYASQAGPLIDLVTFGTLVREQMFSRLDTELIVLAPSSVKRLGAWLTYDPIKKGKKIEYRNNQGVAGGSFKKHEIYKVLTENTTIKSKWIDFLRTEEDAVTGQKNIPKPIEDINDAVVMYHIAEKVFYEENKDFIKTVDRLRSN